MGFTTRQLEGVAEANAPKAVSVLRVWGTVSKQETAMSTFGPYRKFSGSIAAINLVNGDEARSQLLLLPAVAEAAIAPLVEKAVKEGSSAQIALEVTVTYNAPKTANSTYTKFSYGVKPLIDFKGEDALSAMAKELPAPVMVKAIEEKANGKRK